MRRVTARFVVVVAAWLVVGCGTGESGAPSNDAPADVGVDGARDPAPPVADAGDDHSVDVGDEVVLDGTESSDPNGDNLTYQWTFLQQPQQSGAELSDAAASQPSFVADVAGEYVVSLVVSDGEHNSARDTVIVTAGGEGNQPPSANAGEDRTVSVGGEVVLDASGSTDQDTTDLSYFWRVVSQPDESSVSVRGSTNQQAQLRPTHAGAYEVELVVSDGQLSDTDTVVIEAEGSLGATCLLISEYIEGSSSNKAIELFNCQDDAIDLENFGFCVVANENVTCTSYDIELSGTLASGEVLTLCHTSLDAAVFDPSGCDVTSGSVNFNGDDRIVVYEDVDASGDFSEGDQPTDVFGEVTNQPSNASTWANVTLRRCDFTRFDGESGFDYSAFFVEAEELDDFSDFGVAPVEGC